MSFISHLINQRISRLISRFDVPDISPHMVDKIVDHIGVEREATTRSYLNKI